MTEWLPGWMSKARSAKRRALDEGNWNQEKGKKTTADRRWRTAIKDQRPKKQEIQYANEYSDPDSRG
jgi:hypothetical protein